MFKFHIILILIKTSFSVGEYREVGIFVSRKKAGILEIPNDLLYRGQATQRS